MEVLELMKLIVALEKVADRGLYHADEALPERLSQPLIKM